MTSTLYKTLVLFHSEKFKQKSYFPSLCVLLSTTEWLQGVKQLQKITETYNFNLC